MSSRKCLLICCGVTFVLLVSIAVVFIVLFFTVFKPKDPLVSIDDLTLTHFNVSFIPMLSLDATVSLIVTIGNQNYGSFKYENSTAYIYYHGELIAEAPIEKDEVPARKKHNISTTVDIIGDKLISSPYFLLELEMGTLNLTSSTTLRGRVRMFKIFKHHATAHSICDISVFVKTQTIGTICHSKIKI